MADLVQTEGLNSTFSGLYTSGSIPKPILDSGLTKLGKINYLHKDIAVFSRIVHSLYGTRKQFVSGRKHKIVQLSELARQYPIKVASGDTNYGDSATQHRVIGLTNDHAAELKVEDTLYVRDLFTATVNQGLVKGQVVPASGGSQGTNVGPDYLEPAGYQITDVEFSRDFGSEATNGVFALPEQIRVAEVGAPNSMGSGYTRVVIDRCMHGSGNAGINDGTIVPRSVVYGASTGVSQNVAAAQINTQDVLLRAMPSFFEGTGAPSGLHKTVDLEENFTQEYKYAVEITDEQAIEGQFISEKPLDLHRWLLTRRMARDHEYQYLFGRKAATRNAEGKIKMYMGGVLESIPQDTDHYIKYKSSSLNWKELLYMGKENFVLGGSDERYLFCGYSLDARLRAMFYDSGMIRINPEKTKQFNVEVNTLFVSGGRYHIIPSQIMEEAGFGLKALSLDLSYPSYTFVTHPEWDMKTNKDIAPKDMKIYKEEVYGILGMERRYREYQALLDFENIA